MAFEKQHQKFVDKVSKQNAEHFEEGEMVDAAVEGQTGPVSQSPLFAIVDGVRRMSGNLQGRVVILTDRNLYVGRNGMKPKIDEMKLKCPRAEAGSHLSMPSGVMLVDDERIHFNLPQGRFAKQLAEAVASGSASAGGG
jgi:hypothetical protein